MTDEEILKEWEIKERVVVTREELSHSIDVLCSNDPKEQKNFYLIVVDRNYLVLKKMY